jgi:hypothetical protein
MVGTGKYSTAMAPLSTGMMLRPGSVCDSR